MIKKFRSLPHILLFNRTSNRSVIEKDVFRWFQVYQPQIQSNTTSAILIWLLDSHPEFRNLFYARVGSYSSFVGKILLAIAKLLYKPIETLGFSQPIHIGAGLFIYCGFGTIVGHKSIGENCTIGPDVTLGYKGGEGGMPIIGHNVYIGAGAKLLGEITVGDNAIIGANAVVTKNIPPNCTVVGVPARIIKRDGIRVKEALSSHRNAE